MLAFCDSNSYIIISQAQKGGFNGRLARRIFGSPILIREENNKMYIHVEMEAA